MGAKGQGGLAALLRVRRRHHRSQAGRGGAARGQGRGRARQPVPRAPSWPASATNCARRSTPFWVSRSCCVPRRSCRSSASDNAGEIERAGRHLLSLVDDLIDLGGVEAGHLELTMAPVAVETVINESLSMVAPLAANQGIRIVFEGGDARNARGAGRCGAAAPDHHQPVVQRDQVQPPGRFGAGVLPRASDASAEPATTRCGSRCTTPASASRPTLASRVFSAFERLGAERGQIEGTGIGLAISRRLVSAMGGTIGYESRVQEGSTFWIDLPAVRPAVQESLPAADALPAAPRGRGRCAHSAAAGAGGGGLRPEPGGAAPAAARRWGARSMWSTTVWPPWRSWNAEALRPDPQRPGHAEHGRP